MEAKRYRIRPKTMTAIQFRDVKDLPVGVYQMGVWGEFRLDTPSGYTVVEVGDYVVTDMLGTRYVVSEEIFDLTHEEVEL